MLEMELNLRSSWPQKAKRQAQGALKTGVCRGLRTAIEERFHKSEQHIHWILALCSRGTFFNYYFSPYPRFLLPQPQFLPRSLGENSFPTTTISVGCTLVTWREIPFQLQFSARFISEVLDSPRCFHPPLSQPVALYLNCHKWCLNWLQTFQWLQNPPMPCFHQLCQGVERLCLTPPTAVRKMERCEATRGDRNVW